MNEVNYENVLQTLSIARIDSFKVLLPQEPSHCQLYAAYAWARDVSAAIYPLMQSLEIILRNSIDQEARRRFGEKWWDSPNKQTNTSKPKHGVFRGGIQKAEGALLNKWKDQKRRSLNLGFDANLPDTCVRPTFRHDDIIAATDFGVWRDVLTDAHASPDVASRDKFLWPNSMGRVFKRYNQYSSSPDSARREILNDLSNLKNYRNRLFHHDCIWSRHDAKDARSAIDSIREKINLIEKLILVISPETHNSLMKWGELSRVKEICSESGLENYLSKCV